MTRHVLVGPESGGRATVDGNDLDKSRGNDRHDAQPGIAHSLALIPSTSTLSPRVATTRKRLHSMSSMAELHDEVRGLKAAKTLGHHEYEFRQERLAHDKWQSSRNC